MRRKFLGSNFGLTNFNLRNFKYIIMNDPEEFTKEELSNLEERNAVEIDNFEAQHQQDLAIPVQFVSKGGKAKKASSNKKRTTKQNTIPVPPRSPRSPRIRKLTYENLNVSNSIIILFRGYYLWF